MTQNGQNFLQGTKRVYGSIPSYPNKRVHSQQDTTDNITKPECISLPWLCSSGSTVGSQQTQDVVQGPDSEAGRVEASEGSKNTAIPNQPEILIDDEHDTCFGMFDVKALSSQRAINEDMTIPVKIDMDGSLCSFFCELSKKYMGLLDRAVAPTLHDLVQRFSLTLTATLSIPGTKGELKSKIRERGESRLRIVLYGRQQDCVSIGDLLSEKQLFLQHPFEYDPSKFYINPQILMRLGTDANAQRVARSTAELNPAFTKDTLSKSIKSQVDQVFDAADGPREFTEVEPSPRLITSLTGYQVKALAMMAERERGALEDAKFPVLWNCIRDEDGQVKYQHTVTGRYQSNKPRLTYGGLLADEMGLGKSLTTLALIAWSLDHTSGPSSNTEGTICRPTLIIAPMSTIPGWIEQAQNHFLRKSFRTAIYHGQNRFKRSAALLNHDIVFTTYETVRSEWVTKDAGKNGINSPLYSVNWHRIVLDEAHHIRNRSSQTHDAVCSLKAQYQWCLTGTPIHNSLDDYGSLLTFLKVHPFDQKKVFDYWIATPVKKGNLEGMKRLKRLVMATSLRRTKSMVENDFPLPPRTDTTHVVELRPSEKEVYDFFRSQAVNLNSMSNPVTLEGQFLNRGGILPIINSLRLICNHGEALLPLAALKLWQERSLVALQQNWMQKQAEQCDSCTNKVDHTDYDLPCCHNICAKCIAFKEEDDTELKIFLCPLCCNTGSPSVSRTTPDVEMSGTAVTESGYQPSSKVQALLDNLERIQTGISGTPKVPIKSVVFSSWTKMLDLIEIALRQRHFQYKRIDGQKSLSCRQAALSTFRDDPSCTVMLASIGSVGEGVDLRAANHVHLMEPQWNPMAEEQALARVHRLGQKRAVFTIRYIVNKSIEKYIQDIQNEKLRLVDGASFGSKRASSTELERTQWKNLRAALQ